MFEPRVRIQEHDFDLGFEYLQLQKMAPKAGAVVTFVGLVREFSNSSEDTLYLEHYPGMTESILTGILDEASTRWPICSAQIIHRIGSLRPSEQIVFVGVCATHRQPAFEACQYLMDYLKTQAPLWKREGLHWVESKTSDQEQAERWQVPKL